MAAVGQYPTTEEGQKTELAQTHPYTCNSCQVAFRSSDAQKGHMRSDWHRYNLKRRVASLPPISSEVFTEKVLNAQASSTAAVAKATFERACAACQRTYYSENAYQNHIGSRGHKQREAQSGTNGSKDENMSVMSGTFSMGDTISEAPKDEGEIEEEFSEIINGMQKSRVEDDESPLARPHRPRHHLASEDHGQKKQPAAEQNKFVLAHCLFCSYESEDAKSSVLHMSRSHGMFIPEQSYLSDMEGLLEYLHGKINQNYECLYCHQLKSSAGAVQTHMRDKGHCMIAFESEDEMLEVGQFYDFTSTYSDDEEGGNPEGWETDSDASSADDDDDSEDDSTETPVRGSRNAAYVNDFELHLPSGRVAGHRSLAKYFRQNLRNYPTPEERLAKQQMLEAAAPGEDEQLEEGAASRNRALVSRANGGLGMIGVSDSQKRAVRAEEVRELQRANRSQREYQWALNKRGNSQKHFRDPLLQ